MANYLTISETATECEGCGADLPPGCIALTDEIDGRLVPQCKSCAFALDRRLAAVWITSIAGLRLEAFGEVIEELLQMDEFRDLAEPEKSN